MKPWFFPRSFTLIPCAAATLLWVGCAETPKPGAPVPPVTSALPTAEAEKAANHAGSANRAEALAGGVALGGVSRGEFNRLAAELALPIFWIEDKSNDGVLSPSELAVYWGLVPGAKLRDYVVNGAFTPKAHTDIESVLTRAKKPNLPEGLSAREAARRTAVRKELAQARITLVETDLTNASTEEKRFVTYLTSAAERVENLYAKQLGTFGLRSQIAPGDTASQFAFFRNQSPKCVAPDTQTSDVCSALSNPPKGKLSGLYPAELLTKPKFCDDLSALGKRDKKIIDPFHVVAIDERAKGALKAVPYHETFVADVAGIRADLEAAADALGSKELALQTYLRAAGKAFSDDLWWPADEAWAAMNASNSKYYLRIGPDEMYREPCASKALYHVSFGLINQGSLKWQNKLDPLKNDMEKELADMAGPPYAARNVSFKIPDFVDIAINAGDSRPPDGATIGQSLPNFGPVANEGRGRTAAMVNFYSDRDSIEALETTTASLFCKSAMAHYTTDREPLLMGTVLHEAAHNLGPAHQYKANGKDDRATFGGPLAATLEELKAQTASLYFTSWLADKKQITQDEAEKSHVRDVVWSFGHISRGMYDEEKKPKNYSQLAAIQLGWLMQNGAVTWNTKETSANGKDQGCFDLSLAKFPAAVRTLMIEVAQIKGQGDKSRAEKLVKEYVDVAGEKKKVHDVIKERVLRSPKPSFVYAIKLD